jgi:hypothetical protein
LGKHVEEKAEFVISLIDMGQPRIAEPGHVCRKELSSQLCVPIQLAQPILKLRK